MKRVDKYPETDSFVYENVNPSNRIAGDCVVRAIANAEGKSWDEVFDALCVLSRKYHEMPNDKRVYGRYLAEHGWTRCKQPRKPDGGKYTGAEFVCDFGFQSNVIAHIGGHHMVCIKPKGGKYKVHDIWDSTGGCIGIFWIKEKGY